MSERPLAAVFAENKPFAKAIISSPYIERTVIPTTSAVCQLRMEDNNCFHGDTTRWTLVFPAAISFLKFLYSSAARLNSSVSIGRLFDMARKKVLNPIAIEGSSRAICCTDMPNPFHADA